MTGDPSRVTNRLAQFVASSQWEAIPPDVRCEGVRGLLNFVGCALGGARDDAMDIAVKVLTPFFGPPQAIVIGRGERPDAMHSMPRSSTRSAPMSSNTTTRIWQQ
jgi:2-methylcitrate dehydratase PrpD